MGAKATWVARYGSITFNQYGRELPTGGMNEAGLVVEAMALSKTRYAEPDHRPYMGLALQWRQYLLDTCGTMAKIIDADRKIRISDKAPGPGMHVLVLDKTADCAVIEFLEDRMKVHTGIDLPVAVWTNDTYAHPQIRHIDVSDFDFSRATPVKILDVNADLTGNFTGHFSDYAYDANRDQIGRAYLTSGIPNKRLDALARFPESFECPE